MRVYFRCWFYISRNVDITNIGLLPDTYNWGLRMRQEYLERLPAIAG